MITGKELEEIIYQKGLTYTRDNNGKAPWFLILDHDTHYELRTSCYPGYTYDQQRDEYAGMRIALVRKREGEEPIIEVK
ncbi:MAG TPA: hypothetical protein ENI06_01325 [Spirochaetales bacterium]|nr:hypothetical protein [Spirochaetales bacterium]